MEMMIDAEVKYNADKCSSKLCWKIGGERRCTKITESALLADLETPRIGEALGSTAKSTIFRLKE